eukprot:1859192-Pyramimonas_sp.AAC.1
MQRPRKAHREARAHGPDLLARPHSHAVDLGDSGALGREGRPAGVPPNVAPRRLHQPHPAGAVGNAPDAE